MLVQQLASCEFVTQCFTQEKYITHLPVLSFGLIGVALVLLEMKACTLVQTHWYCPAYIIPIGNERNKYHLCPQFPVGRHNPGRVKLMRLWYLQEKQTNKQTNQKLHKRLEVSRSIENFVCWRLD